MLSLDLNVRSERKNKSSIFDRNVQGVFCVSYSFAQCFTSVHETRKKEKEYLVHDFIVIFYYFLLNRVLDTRSVYLRLNPTFMCSIVHPTYSFEDLCTVVMVGHLQFNLNPGGSFTQPERFCSGRNERTSRRYKRRE